MVRIFKFNSFWTDFPQINVIKFEFFYYAFVLLDVFLFNLEMNMSKTPPYPLQNFFI